MTSSDEEMQPAKVQEDGRIALADWLAGRLATERRFILLQLEERHSILANEVMEQWYPATGPVPVPPALAPHEVQLGASSLDMPDLSNKAMEQHWKKPSAKATTPAGKRPPQRIQHHVSRHMKALHEGGDPDFANERCAWTRRVVDSVWFDITSGVLILLNTLVMALEMQYKGTDAGFTNNFPDYEQPADVSWPGFKIAFQLLEVAFVTAFTVELLLRVMAQKFKALKNPWILIDSVLVTIALVQIFSRRIYTPLVIRLVRLLRIGRGFMLLQQIRAFDTLFLLVRSLQASIYAFVWSFALLLLLQVIVGIILSQTVQGYINDQSIDHHLRHQVFKYFGTFTNMMLTMNEITLANWVPSCRFLVDHVSEWFGPFYIIYRCMICFAVVRVISAVFITETHRIAAADEHVVIRQKELHRMSNVRRLRDMFRELDVSGDGYLEWTEFENLVKDDMMQSWARSVDVETSELAELFNVLDGGDGRISVDEFVDGVLHIRGQARNWDMMKLLTIANTITGQLGMMNASLAKSSKQLPL